MSAAKLRVSLFTLTVWEETVLVCAVCSLSDSSLSVQLITDTERLQFIPFQSDWPPRLHTQYGASVWVPSLAASPFTLWWFSTWRLKKQHLKTTYRAVICLAFFITPRCRPWLFFPFPFMGTFGWEITFCSEPKWKGDTQGYIMIGDRKLKSEWCRRFFKMLIIRKRNTAGILKLVFTEKNKVYFIKS